MASSALVTHATSHALDGLTFGPDLMDVDQKLKTLEPSREDDSDTDGEEINGAPRPPRITERRRKQNEMFKAWMVNRKQKVAKEETDKTVLDSNDELLSIRSLMAKQESNVIISDPREYQLELFEKAKTENVIAVLDTGSGKTLIAVMLLRHVMEEELANRAQGKPPRISFFLVHSVALVFQQFAVLEANLDQPMERFCGEMNVDMFSKQVWAGHFRDNMALVCTSDILLHCLLNSFITMSQINLLVFDEAHKTKKNHSYARIIKDFYVSESMATRPKVFGMTASPVDAKLDVVEAANTLETLLHSRIATTSDLALLRQSVSKPKEQICTYETPPKPYMTTLCGELKSRFNEVQVFDRLFTRAQELASELGEWAADHLWQLALADDEDAEKLQRKTERVFAASSKAHDITVLDGQLQSIKEAQKVVNAHVSPQPEQEPRGISSKVKSLKKILNKVFELPNDSRCIVFVTRRLSTRLLAAIMNRIGNQNLRIGVLVGAQSGEAGDVNVSVRQQMLTISKFRKGELNVLLATSIAEEGLDIPDCNYVIRFDLYNTLIQYVQSRGRARRKNSTFISMIEGGNIDHRRIINDVRNSEDIMRNFCMALPKDRLLQGNEHDLEEAMAEEKNLPVYIEPGTGAKLNFHSALARIEHFVGCLRQDDETTARATYAMSYDGRRFTCELILPPNSPIVSVLGRPYPRKSLAKRSAAFEAALILRADGHIDEHLLPKYHKELPKMRNAHLALNSKKSKSYPMRVKPMLWEKTWGTVPTSLYMTIIDLKNPDAMGRPFVPLAFMTRTPMIEFPSFPVFPRPGLAGDVVCTRVEVALPLLAQELQMLNTFTLRVFQDVFHKEYEDNTSKMSYWLAPVIRSAGTLSSSREARSNIDWNVLQFVQTNPRIAWNPGMPNDELEDRFMVDEWAGAQRYFTVKVDSSKGPFSKVPDGVPPRRFMTNILDYSSSLFANSRKKREGTWDEQQPVLEARRVTHRLNWLDDWSSAEADAPTLCYVCPEPLLLSALPTKVVAAAYMFPVVLHRLEAYLLAQELCDNLGLVVEPGLALEAITKDSDNTEEHREVQVQFQRGMGRNYERLEFIGDAFLKMATSIALYAKNAKDDEFHSHVKRMLMICNKNLFNTAMDLNLYEYVRDKSFSRRTWYPDGLTLLKGKGKDKDAKYDHALNDKSIADVCEALIGASLLSAEPGDMDMAVKSVTKFVNNSYFTEENDHQAEKFSDYLESYTVPEWQMLEASATHINLVDQCSREDPGYRFKSPRLLKAAFTHPSTPFIWEKIPCYQRLEFLGDALLDMVCVRFLFDGNPERDPQWLTEHKMAMVSNKFLGALCIRLGFNKHMRHLNSMLAAQITEYVTDITDAEATSSGARDYWMNTRNPPKCLPDIVESYIGALFIDSDFDYRQVERFFEDHVRWYFEDMSIYDSFANAHPTTHLSNLLSTSLGCSNFRLLCDELPTVDGRSAENPRIVAAVMVHDQIIADSEGTSSRYAKIRASQLAVEELEGMMRVEFVRRFKCDCKVVDGDMISGDAGEMVDSAI